MGRFRSKAQWWWAFANRKMFARKWAHRTPSYRSLPRRKGAARGRRSRY